MTHLRRNMSSFLNRGGGVGRGAPHLLCSSKNGVSTSEKPFVYREQCTPFPPQRFFFLMRLTWKKQKDSKLDNLSFYSSHKCTLLFYTAYATAPDFLFLTTTSQRMLAHTSTRSARATHLAVVRQDFIVEDIPGPYVEHQVSAPARPRPPLRLPLPLHTSASFLHIFSCVFPGANIDTRGEIVGSLTFQQPRGFADACSEPRVEVKVILLIHYNSHSRMEVVEEREPEG